MVKGLICMWCDLLRRHRMHCALRHTAQHLSVVWGHGAILVWKRDYPDHEVCLLCTKT